LPSGSVEQAGSAAGTTKTILFLSVIRLLNPDQW
jgi:hypothetical protein